MNRRAFFKHVPLLPAVALGLTGFDVKPARDPHYELEAYGYKLRFTGWKTMQNNSTMVSQWIAFPTAPHLVKRMEAGESISVYCSFPGAVGFYQPGYIFDVGVQTNAYGQRLQRPLQEDATEDEKRDMKAEQLRRILTFIQGESTYLSDGHTASFARGGSFRKEV